MATYHFKNSPVIDRVEVRTLRKDISQATIVAKDNVEAAELEKIRTVLGRHKLSTMMDSVDGHAAIQVRGLKDATKLFSYFAEAGISTQGMHKEVTAGDHHKKETMKDRVRGKAMFLSAVFYTLGNISYIVSGIQRLNHLDRGILGDTLYTKKRKANISEMMIGATFGVGDLLMMFYGTDRGDEELSTAAQALRKHLHQKGIKIPEGDALTPESLHHSGALKTTDRWLRKHIGQVKCLTEAVAGLFTIGSALEPGNLNHGKLAAGFLLVSGWFATFLLDKPRGHEVLSKEKHHENFIDRVKDDPRAYIAGPFSMGNNISNLYGALGPNGERVRFKNEVKDAQAALGKANGAGKKAAEANLAYVSRKQHDYGWNVVTACFFLIANGLFRLSGSKHAPKETDDDKRVMNDLVTMGANVIAGLPGPITNKALDDTAEYVSKLNHVTLNKEEVAEAIRNKVAELSQTKWKTKVANATPDERIHRGASEQFANRFPTKSGNSSRAEQVKSNKKSEEGPSIA